MNVVERAKRIILTPKAEWEVIAGETPTIQELYTKYVMILAAIPAVAGFIGFSLVGIAGIRVPITYGIVTKLGGTIEVQSKEGEGTIFTVLLPTNKDRVGA